MFGRRITIFKLLGFEVRLDASWLLLAVLIIWSLAVGVFPYSAPHLQRSEYWWMGVWGAIGLFVSIIFHEFCHSVVARHYGLPMNGITLFIFGGIAEMGDEPPSAKVEFLMAVAGPLSSVVLGFLFYGLKHAGQGSWPAPVVAVVGYLGWINWILAGFNMIPAFPLDGGRILRAALWHWRGDLRQATKIASSLGSSFGIILMILGFLELFTNNFVGAVWTFLIGMFIRSASQSSYQQAMARSVLQGEPVRRFMTANPVSVQPDLSVQSLVDDYIYRYHHKLFPVVRDSRELMGYVSTEQVKQVPRDEWSRHSVQEILQPCSDGNAITPDTDANQLLALINRTGRSRFLVLENHRLAGIVSSKDLTKFLSTKLELQQESEKAA